MPDGDLVSFAFADAARLRATSDDGSMAAEFVPEANMLCCSLTRKGSSCCTPGRGVRAYGDRGKTMGIPLLHPWANRLSADLAMRSPDDRQAVGDRPADSRTTP